MLRIKIWTADGRIVYSDETRLIGDRFPLGADELEVLASGGTDAEISDLSRAGEPLRAQGRRSLLEVYTRVRSPEGEPLLFEAYYSAADIARPRQQVYDAFQPITLGGLLVLVAVTTPLLWALTRRLERTGRDRERLLEAAADASESERRRIARDLHDGVVQDLAGTSFALSATARDPRTDPDVAQRLEPMAGVAARQPAVAALAAGRDLPARPAAPTASRPRSSDLVAPAAAAGVARRSSRCTTSRAPPTTRSRLVWRVAQEAVRNALRHADADAPRPSRCARSGDRLALDVTDDGVGFDPAHRRRRGGSACAACATWSREAGGRLDVRSAPGEGTTVHLEVPTVSDRRPVIRVVLVDDHAVVRTGLAQLLGRRRRHRGRRPGRRRRRGRGGRPRTRPDVVRDGPADARRRRRRGHPADPRRGARREVRRAHVVLRQRAGSSPRSTPARSATCSRTPTPRTSSTASGRSAAASRRSTRGPPASC